MIFPVLLCGGSGTLLWPLSRKSYPKQFADVVGDESLFQASARRFTGDGFADPLVVTGDPFRFIVTEQLDEIGVAPSGILIEPEGRNTAPAAVAAALYAQTRDKDAMILLVPSDHAVAQPETFRDAVKAGDAMPTCHGRGPDAKISPMSIRMSCKPRRRNSAATLSVM